MSTKVIRSGGRAVVKSLMAQGISRVSCVPGESFLPVLDALLDSSIELDVCRHEAGAGNMALAVAKLTGRAGVAAVSRGPGAMHASIALHTAEQDGLPLILLIGQVPRRDRDRGAFQEVDYRNVFGSVAKWVTSIESVERIPETIARAVRIAEGGRPGPVVIEMPEDVLSSEGTVQAFERSKATVSAPPREVVRRAINMIQSSTRPVVILGRSKWTAEAAKLMEVFAERFAVPVIAGFRCQDYLDNDSEYYAGHLGFSADRKLRGRLAEADLVLGIGGHFGDVETQGYEILGPGDGREVIHVVHSEHDLDRYLQATLPIEATPFEFLEAMLAEPPTSADRSDWVEGFRAEEVERSTPRTGCGDPLADIMGYLQGKLASDTIVANGAGNYALWVHRFIRFREFGTQLAPASGAMGFGLPAGISGARVREGQPVVVFAGDGCFTMALPELSTLIGRDDDLTIVLVNNAAYGTIRLHQERRFPDRVSGTDLVNPDFVALARAYGIQAGRAESLEEFATHFEAFSAQGGPRLIEVVTNKEQSTPDLRLSELAH